MFDGIVIASVVGLVVGSIFGKFVLADAASVKAHVTSEIASLKTSITAEIAKIKL
jgi:hypothetical protein